ncbi:phage tail protein [Ekhidna sp.]|uniref:phage tail protein n=1 Tax=Ekhidna sp. TaxID=2608089 RepID=UPI00329A7E94
MKIIFFLFLGLLPFLSCDHSHSNENELLASLGNSNSLTQLQPNVPIGSIVAFAGRPSDIPTGWKPCDGRKLWSGAFPKASQVLTGLWGPSDPDGFFTLPLLNGYFLRGVDTDGYMDPDYKERENWDSDKGFPWVGTLQSDDYKSHYHKYSKPNQPTGGASGGNLREKSGDFDTAPSGGNETRPVNAYVYWIIYVGPVEVITSSATGGAVEILGKYNVETYDDDESLESNIKYPPGTKRDKDGNVIK